MTCTVPSSGCGGVYVIGAWPNVVLVTGGSPVGRPHQYLIPWVAWIDGRGQQTPAAQRLSSTLCLGGRRGAATGTQSQASLLQLPPASLWGLVIKCLEGSPEKGLVKGC